MVHGFYHISLFILLSLPPSNYQHANDFRLVVDRYEPADHLHILRCNGKNQRQFRHHLMVLLKSINIGQKEKISN